MEWPHLLLHLLLGDFEALIFQVWPGPPAPPSRRVQPRPAHGPAAEGAQTSPHAPCSLSRRRTVELHLTVCESGIQKLTFVMNTHSGAAHVKRLNVLVLVLWRCLPVAEIPFPIWQASSTLPAFPAHLE